jgi:hypothetical protein
MAAAWQQATRYTQRIKYPTSAKGQTTGAAGLSSQVPERPEQACVANGPERSEVGAVHPNRLGHSGEWPLPEFRTIEVNRRYRFLRN